MQNHQTRQMLIDKIKYMLNKNICYISLGIIVDIAFVDIALYITKI